MVGATHLFSLVRDGHEEIRIDGEILVCHGDRVLYRTGDAVGRFPARSLLKPFQFLAANVPLDLAHVPALGSISATAEQVARIREWHPSPPIEKLKLPPTYPLDEVHRGVLKAEGREPSVYWHTCFTKHVSILEACAREGWDPASYTATSHPFHERLLGTLKAFLDEDVRAVPTVTDGCKLPSPVLTTPQLARLYRGLVAAEAGTKRGKIARAMMDHPEWIGGPGRLDTRLMQAAPGRIVAKEGADGLLALGLAPGGEYPEGLGIVLKLAAGYHPHLAALALAPLLSRLGLPGVHQLPPGQEAWFHYEPLGKGERALLDISPRVDEHLAVWPGDVPFSRDVSLDTAKGSHLTLSSIRTTVHVGAHTDAPSHFGSGSPGIDAVDPSLYVGPCQVIEVKTPRGRLISLADVQGVTIRARRVLFKTGSYPDPALFNEDFVALSAEVVAWLAWHDVKLVGIDTPSVDACHSKDLPAHHATQHARMAILEGVVLTDVKPGLYELVALPLKIRDADASPVRAVLRPLDA